MNSKLVVMLVTLLCFSFAFQAHSSVVGLSNYPLTMKSKAMNTEINTVTSGGNGTGINVRYFQRLNDRMNFDFGGGVSESERTSRVFFGFDNQIIPDYGRQPRVSIKAMADTLEIGDERVSNIGFAPIISKGVSFSGYEAFPYLALPFNMMLIGDSERTESLAAAVGMSGRVPFMGYENMILNAEINSSIRNSFTGFVVGLSLPID